MSESFLFQPNPTAPLLPMQRALQLAESAISLTEPNPRVGCVLVAADGRWIGEGHTQAAGLAHAEVAALRDAQSKGHDVHGATAYVTLEPCSHHGRTPPCCDALIAAGVAQVVVAVGDPNPAVNGQGMARLRDAGIEVVNADAAFADASRELNIGFFSRMQRGRPWVRMKIAASLDGRTALENGKSQWITSEAARRDGHAWRRRAAVLLTGSGTMLADDPRLDVREHPVARQPLRVVVDSRLSTLPSARLREADAPMLFATAFTDGENERYGDRIGEWRRLGAEVLNLPRQASGALLQVDLDALMKELARRGANEVHIEAGARLNAALMKAGWVDELLVYQAPVLLGPGRGMAALGPLEELAQAEQFAFHRVELVGCDLRLLLRRPRTAGT